MARRTNRSRPRKKSALAKVLPFLLKPVFIVLVKALPLLIVFTVVILSGMGIRSSLLADSYFRVKEVNVSGLESVGREEILSQLPHLFQSSLISLDIQGLSHHLKQNLRIKEARVFRNLPDRIRIEIKERTPQLVLRTRSERSFLIDEEGFIFAALPDSKTDRLILEDLDPRAASLKLGMRYPKRSVISKAKRLEQELPRLPFFSRLIMEKLEIDNAGRMSAVFREGLEIRFKEDIDEGLRRLRAIQEDMVEDIQQAELIDLRFEELVIKPKKGKRLLGLKG